MIAGRFTAVAVGAASCLVSAVACAQDPGADPGQILSEHPPQQAVKLLQERLATGEAADDVRAALGIARTLHAVETLGRDLHALGPRSDLVDDIPLLRLPVPRQEEPPVVTADDVARAIDRFAGGLEEARSILQQVEGDVEITIGVGRMGFDFDRDDQTGEQERLVAILEALGMVNLRAPREPTVEEVGGPGIEPDDTPEERQRKMEQWQARQRQEWERQQQRMQAQQAQMREQIESLEVDFDTADVQWLIAYTHLLSGLADVALAHEFDRWFEHCGHLVFQKVDSPYDFLHLQRPGFTVATIGDAAAALHLMRLPVQDAQRLERSRQHFLSATRGAKRMFELVRAETDNGREWIPNARQSAAFPNIEVTEEIIDAWLAVVDDVEGVLQGEKLVPFWRGSQTAGQVERPDVDEVDDEGASLRVDELLIAQPQPDRHPQDPDRRGINLRRVFEEQEQFDLILWVQGTAAAPYPEQGKPFMTAESFERMQEVTNGNFFTFAIWFN